MSHASTDVRGSRELALHALSTAVEELACGEWRAVGFGGIGRAKDLEQKARRLTRLLFLALRAIAFHGRDAGLRYRPSGLPHGERAAGEQANDGEGGGRGDGAIAPNELARAVPEGILARVYRQTVEIAPEVTGELLDGAIAPANFLLQGTQHDDVEIAGERVVQPVRCRASGGGDIVG